MLPPHLVCNDNYCRQCTPLFKLSGLQTVMMNSDSHSFRARNVSSLPVLEACTKLSPAPAKKHRRGRKARQKKVKLLLSSKYHRQPASQSTSLGVFLPVPREWLHEKPTWLVCIHHLRYGKQYLFTAVTLNQRISYKKKKTKLSLTKDKSFQMVQLSRQINF